MSAILLMALGAVIIICPLKYMGELTLVGGYTLLLVALVMILNFFSSNKSLMEYIKFCGALILGLVGLCVVVFRDDIMQVLAWMFGFLLILDGARTAIHSFTYARRSQRKGWWVLTILSALLGAGKDILNVGKKVGQLPGALTDSLNALAKGKLKINIAATELEDPMERLGSYVKYVVLSVIACVLFIGSCILAGIDPKPKTENGIPVIAMAGIVFSIALAIYSVGKLTKKK